MNNVVLSEEERVILFEMMKSGMTRENMKLEDLPANLKSMYLKLGGDTGDYCFDL
jgi:hypothetical protein